MIWPLLIFLYEMLCEGVSMCQRLSGEDPGRIVASYWIQTCNVWHFGMVLVAESQWREAEMHASMRALKSGSHPASLRNQPCRPHLQPCHHLRALIVQSLISRYRINESVLSGVPIEAHLNWGTSLAFNFSLQSMQSMQSIQSTHSTHATDIANTFYFRFALSQSVQTAMQQPL